MNRLLLISSFALLSAVSAFGAACVTSTFKTYNAAGFNCTVATNSGLVTFSNFEIIMNELTGAGTGVELTDDEITVSPTGNSTDTIGFQFGSNLQQPPGAAATGFLVTGTQLYNLVLIYDVVVASGNPLKGTHANVVASATTSGGQTGSASLSKDVLEGGSVVASANVNNVQIVSALAPFGPLTNFTTRDTVSIQANNASANVASFGNFFQTTSDESGPPNAAGVPEPKTLIPLGLGLLGIGLAGRRRRV